MKQPLVLDGRNLYDPAFMQQMGFDYVGIGRSSAPQPPVQAAWPQARLQALAA
jgi:hypothetical protein